MVKVQVIGSAAGDEAGAASRVGALRGVVACGMSPLLRVT